MAFEFLKVSFRFVADSFPGEGLSLSLNFDEAFLFPLKCIGDAT